MDKSSAMDFSETIEIKVFDVEETLQSDSYFFAYFQNMNLALEQIRDAVRTYKPFMQTAEVHDTTGVRMVSQSPPAQPSPPSEPMPIRSSYGLRLASFLRPFSIDSGSSSNAKPSEFTHVPRPSSAITASPLSMTPRVSSNALPTTADVVTRSTSDGPLVVALKGTDYHHTYPPPPSPSQELNNAPPTRENSSTSTWGVPAWLRGRALFNIPSASTSGATIGRRGIQETISTITPSSSRTGDTGSSDFGFFSVLDTSDVLETEVVDKFRTTFAFDEKENLLGR